MVEIEDELDDVVEEAVPYMFMSDSRYVGGLFAGLMTAGGEAPPPRPSRDGDLDPGDVLDDQQEQLRRRLEQISPASGRHFVGMCQAVAERGQRVTSVTDAFNNAREMISSLSQVLVAIAELLDEPERDDQLRVPVEQKATARAVRELLVGRLGMSQETAAAWESLELHQYAHRRGLRQPRDMSDELIRLVLVTTTVADDLAALHERHIMTIHQEAARLIDAAADAAALERFARLVPPNHEVSHWLLDRLTNPEWWLFLNSRRYFEDIPEPEGLVHPRWPQSRYLARIAGRVTAPADFARLLIDIAARTRNVRVHEDLVRAATKLPARDAAAVLDSEPAWPLTGMHERVARLVGEPECVRYPTWLAGLMAHVAFHPDSTTAAAEQALAALHTLLALRIVNDQAEGAIATEAMQIDDEALIYALLHLRAHCPTGVKIKIAEHLSESVRRLSEQIAHAITTQKDENYSAVAADVADVMRWYLGDSDLSDRSHLVLPEWPDVVGENARSGMSGLLSGLAGFLIDIHAAGEDLPRPDSASNGGLSARVGLLDRVWLTALAWSDMPWDDLSAELLSNERLAMSSITRSAYVSAIRKRWGTLPAHVQQRIIAMTSRAGEGSAALSLIASAPLLGLAIPHIDEDRLMSHARQLTERPLALISLLQGHPDPYADDFAEHEQPARHRSRQVSRDKASADRARILRTEEHGLGIEDWNALFATLAQFTRKPRLGAAMPSAWSVAPWVDVAFQHIRNGAPLSARTKRRLLRIVLDKKFHWAAATVGESRTGMGHDGFRDTEHSPWARMMLLKLEIAMESDGGLFGQRSVTRVRESLRTDLETPSAARPMLLTLFGFVLPSVHRRSPELWAYLVRPWITARLHAASEADASAVQDLTATYSGLTVRNSLIPAGFVEETQEFFRWVFTHIHELDLPSNFTPSPAITSTFLMLLGEAYDQRLPGPASELLLSYGPPRLQLGALRRFAVLGKIPDEELAGQIRALWDMALARTAGKEHAEFTAAVGTWAAKPDFVTFMGAEWVLAQLESVIDSYGVVDDPGELLDGLAQLVEEEPAFAEQVTRIARKARHGGLLEPQHGVAAGRLIETLETASTQRAQVDQLRAEFVADRILGPLSRFE